MCRGNLIAQDFSKKIVGEAENKKIKCFSYSFDKIDKMQKYSFTDLISNFSIFAI